MGKDLKGKELGTGITQRKTGIYEIHYTDRFGKRKTLYASSAAEARKKRAEAVRQNEQERNVKERYTLREWYEEWMVVYKEPVVRPNTKAQYEMVFRKHILPVLGDTYLDDVRQRHVQMLINDLDKEGYQWETQNKVRVLLTDLFNTAIANDYAIKNPTVGIKLSKSKPRDSRTVLTLDEQYAFFECASGTFYNNLFVAQVNTGLRPGEICGLRASDIDFEHHKLHVERTLIYQKWDGDNGKTFHIGPPKTKQSLRDVPLNDAAEAALRDQMRLKEILRRKYPKDDEFADMLFVTKLNTPICSQVLCDAIKRVTDEINLQRDGTNRFPEFSAHTFRHTYATRAIESGVNPKVLQKILGHATLEMTMDLYVHVTDDFAKDEMAKMGDVTPAQKVINFPVAI